MSDPAISNLSGDQASREKFRFDFDIELVRADDHTGIVQFFIKPNPRRYTEIEENGETLFLDRYLDVAIPLRVMAQQIAGLPIFSSPRTIDSASQYAADRLQAVERELDTGEHSPPAEHPKPHEGFQEEAGERDVAFLSIDICGSTAYQVRDPAGYEKALKILLQELGTAVGQFHGSILKITGDGFIAFLDLPSFTVECDAAVDLGGTLLVVLNESINPALAKAGLSPLQIRVGADYGPASVRQFVIPATGYQQLDATSDALNRAVKIQESCDPGEFRIGRRLYELLHVQWLERATPVEFAGEIVGIEGYQVYRMR